MLDERKFEDIEDPEVAIRYAMSENRMDLALEALAEVDDVEERLYLADRYDLELDAESAAYCRRELAHYIGGMPWGGGL